MILYDKIVASRKRSKRKMVEFRERNPAQRNSVDKKNPKLEDGGPMASRITGFMRKKNKKNYSRMSTPMNSLKGHSQLLHPRR